MRPRDAGPEAGRLALLRQRFGVRVPGGAPPKSAGEPRCTAGAFYVHSRRLGHARDAVGWITSAGRTYRRATVRRSVECDGGEVAAAVEPYGPKAASASPRKSSNSTLSGTPGVSWVNSWLPIPVSPPADPGSTLTAPANSKEPTVSPSTPTARSTKPSSPKAPAASAMPNPSRNSALSSTPGLSWVNSWLPAPVNPPAEPGRTLTAPAPAMSPSCSPTPTARSAKLSLSKSPAVSAKTPKASPGSATPGTPGLFWVNSWLPIPVSPSAEPRRVLTAPASSAAPTSSALPTARSTKRSPSKSPTAKAMPRLSPNSAAPGTPGLSWVNSWLPIPVSPPADPESTLTAPPRSLAPKSSRGADGQVDEAVAVEVASADRDAEVVVRLGAADHPGAVLGEQLAPGTRQPASGAVQHVHGPRVDDGAHVLQRHPDRQVGEAIAVEVANRQRITEAVAELSGPRHPGVLREELAAGTRQPAGGAIQHIHGTSVADGAQILTGDTDGQVSEAIVVEVGPQTLRGPFGRRTAGQTARHWPDRGRKKQDEDHRDPPHLHHLLSSGPRWPARRATNLHLGTWRTRKKAAAEEEPPGSVATFGH